MYLKINLLQLLVTMSGGTNIFITVIMSASVSGTLVYYIAKTKFEEKIKSLTDKIDSLNQDLEHLEIENASIKLNPHLLKNTLNSIHFFSWQTTNAIEKLSEMLKYILEDSGKKHVPIQDEINFLNSYFQVHKLKLSPQTKVNFDINNFSSKKNLRIAPLITINFIENAFIHGDYTLPNSFIDISLSIKNNELVYVVKNRFTTQQKREGSTGMKNFEKRLELLHKGNYSIQQESLENIFISTLKLKLNEN